MTGVCWRVISEGCSWRIGVAVGIGLAGCVAAGAPKVGGHGGPEREPKGEREGMGERRVNRAGGGPVLALHVFSPGGFLGYGVHDLLAMCA